MRSTFSGFEASKSALFASQKSLDIVGHNLSNISTEGYTRQRADQDSVTIAGSRMRYQPTQVSVSAMGTTISGIAQLRDERLDTAFRSEYAETGYFSQSSAMLTEMESVLQELETGEEGNGYNLNSYIKKMYNALETMSNNASDVTNANVFANAVKNTATALNGMSQALTAAADRFKTELTTNVSEINTMLLGVADFNKSIRECMVGGSYTEQYGPNELQDKRNLLLDELSSYGELRVQPQSDGTVTVTLNGHTCVEGNVADRINTQHNANGTLSLTWKTDSSDAASGMGSLKAATDYINGRGLNALSKTESTAYGFPYYQDKLDAFAAELSNVLNNTIPDTLNADGTVATYRKLVGQYQQDEKGNTHVYTDMRVTAGGIAASDDLMKNSDYVLFDKKSTDNSYVLELISKLSSQKHSFSTGTESFTGTFAEYVTDYTGTLGSDAAYANTRNEAAYTTLTEILENRDSTSGVSETDETVSMLTYNKAFQAAARMMTVMDDLLDVIINQMAV